MQTISLAAVMEFKKPRSIMENFARQTLYKMIKHFKPELTITECKSKILKDAAVKAGNEGLFEDSQKQIVPVEGLPEEYHCFEFRRYWAKFRRLGYFVPESEKLYRSLLHDELQLYKFYDFNSFEEENPLIVEEQPSTTTNEDKADESRIEEIKETTEEETKEIDTVKEAEKAAKL